MKTAIALLVLGIALPISGETIDDPSAYDAIFDVAAGIPTNATNSESWTEEGRNLEASDLAIMNSSVSGNDDVLEDFLRERHGSRLADELLSSYRQNGERPARIPSHRASPVPVLPLDSFRISEHRYDWARLAEAHPRVKAIVEVSRPTLDSSSTYMVVRYEFISPKGSVWSSFNEFEKQRDGTWIERAAVSGDITRRYQFDQQP